MPIINALLSAALWALVCPAGCAPISNQGRFHLQESLRYYRQGLFQEAEQAASRVIQMDAGSAGVGEAYYLRGCSRAQLNRPADAEADFALAAERSRRREVAARAHACLGSSAADKGQYEKACQHLARAVDELPARPPLDEALYRYGLSLQRTGQWQMARQILARILLKFRGRPVEEPARRLISWPDDYFSIQCGAFERRSNAEAVADRLRRAGLEAAVRTDIRSGRGVYLVRLGRYATYAEARRDLPRIRGVEPQAFVVP